MDARVAPGNKQRTDIGLVEPTHNSVGHELWRGMNLFVRSEFRDPRDRTRIHFAPVPLK